jgi:hypothetical protein
MVTAPVGVCDTTEGGKADTSEVSFATCHIEAERKE